MVRIMSLIRDGEYSQRKRVRVVNVDVVMPARHVTDHVTRPGDGHRNSFNGQQPTCIRTSLYARLYRGPFSRTLPSVPLKSH